MFITVYILEDKCMRYVGCVNPSYIGFIGTSLNTCFDGIDKKYYKIKTLNGSEYYILEADYQKILKTMLI